MTNYYELAIGRWEGEGGALEAFSPGCYPISAAEYVQEPAKHELLTPALH
jgi:hypothetical protein